MSCPDFVFFYAIEHDIKENREVRVHGLELINTQILIYLLRMHYKLKFREIGEIALMSRQLANQYYYTILESNYYRNVANTRWEELINARSISPN